MTVFAKPRSGDSLPAPGFRASPSNPKERVSASNFPPLDRQNCPNSDWLKKLSCRRAMAAPGFGVTRGVVFNDDGNGNG